MALSEYNDKLKFDLPYGYKLLKEENDEGDEVSRIVGGEYENDDGETAYHFSANFVDMTFETKDGADISDDKLLDDIANNGSWNRVYKLPGKLPALFIAKKTPVSVFGIVLNYFSLMALVRTSEKEANGIMVVANKNEDDPEALVETYRHFLDVVGSIRVDGKQPDSGLISASELANALTPDFDADEECINVSPSIKINVTNGDEVTTFELGSDDSTTFKLTTVDPDESLYPHYNTFVNGSVGMLGLLGAKVNTTGTEYQFHPLSELLREDDYDDDENGDDSRQFQDMIKRIIDKDKESFYLADEADKMESVFHVDPSIFDDHHDKEAELHHGLMHRAYMMSGLRSFAWTLADYCEKKSIDPSDVDFNTAAWIANFVADRNYLNYDGNTYCKGLCGGSDLHVYFVPDSVSNADKKKLLPSEEDFERVRDMKKQFPSYREILSEVHSLDELRKDLEYIFPTVKTIYNKLKEERDTSKVLDGNDADVVYAWIALAKAARSPFFSEDGPMNYWYDQVETDEEKVIREEKERAEWEAEQEKLALENEKEWLSKYGQYLENNPVIEIPGKIFVFSGLAGHYEEKNDPLVKKVEESGGLYRSKVSGKTDYLVVDPKYAGRSKIVGVMEQLQKGKVVKVILEDDLRNFLDGKKSSFTGSISSATAFSSTATSSMPSSQLQKKTASSQSDEDGLGGLASTYEALSAQIHEAESQQLSEEDRENLDKAKEIMNEIGDQMNETEETLDKYGEFLEQKEAREKAAEEEKARKKAEALAKGRSESDLVNMFIILKNEKAMGKLNRSDEEFFEIYEEDFPALNESEVINTRKDILAEMGDEALCAYYAESFKQRSVSDRFTVSTLNIKNVSDIPDLGKCAEFAIENSKEWYEPEEYEQVRKLMDSELAEMRKTLDEQLGPINNDWTKFSTAKKHLRIHIEENESDGSRLKPNSTCFQRVIDKNNLVSAELSSGSGFLSMNVVAMDCFPWYWGVTIRDIWEAANANSICDDRSSTYDGQSVANKALRLIAKEYPEKTQTYSSPAKTATASSSATSTSTVNTSKSANYSSASNPAITTSSSSESGNKPQSNNSQPQKKSGCYVATAVYGSYDCPQVWTLRRFRDNCLALSWFGRLFITLYYAISPTVVKIFGQADWFNKIWKSVLDCMVVKLHNEGYEDTPYEDKCWK